MTDKEQIKAIIKQYADKGKKMYSETIDSRGSRYNAGFWDGYECCAKGLLRELEDMQEEPASKDLNDYAKEILSWEDSNEDWDRLVIRKTAKHFTEWQKQQMMKDAVDGTVFTQLEDGVIMVRSHYFKSEKIRYLDEVKLIIIKVE